MSMFSGSLFIRAIPIIVAIVVAIAIIVIKTMNKKKTEPSLSLEEKIVLLNNQLSAGTITKEEYDKQKADLLKNI